LDSGRCIRLGHDEKNDNGLISSNVHPLYKDREGILWVGGPEGLSFSRLKRKNFYTFRSNDRDGNTLSHNSVTCFSADKRGNLWIGTDGGGLNYFDRKNRRFHCYQHDPLNPNSLRTNSVLSVFNAGDQSVWTGCYLGDLSLFNPKSRHFTHFMYDLFNPNNLGHSDVRDIVQDHRGRIWIATNGRGLHLMIDPKRKTFRHYNYNPANPSGSLASDFCLKIYEDHEGIFWIGTYSGLSRFDSDKNSFRNYTANENNPTGLSHNWVYTILEDSRQRLWIGTYRGLHLFDRHSNTFTVFGLRDGFPSEVINGILEDNHGRLWISTNAGLVRFDVENKIVKTYTMQDELQSDEFNHGSCLKLPSGEMVFGGTNGFTLFHPDSIQDIQSMPPMVITGLWSYSNVAKTSGVTVPIRNPVYENEAIELPHGQAKMFMLTFTALEFLQPGKIQYKYKLDGYQEEWINASKNRTATFTNLGAGRYTFRVTSTNSDGIWNPREARMRIHILPPIWKSPGAYAFFFLLLLAAVVVYHRTSMKWVHLKADLKVQKMEKEKALELESLKSRFFTNISHEFRTPLTLILVPLKNIISDGHLKDWQKLSNQLQLMQRSAERLMRLVNQVLDFNKIEAGRLKLELKEIDIVAFGKGIADTFTPLATDKHITFTFGSNRPRLYGWFDPDKMDMVIFNLLSNAFKFTPRYGEVSLTIKHLPNTQVEIRIEDTGPGIPEEHLTSIFERFYLVDHPISKAREGAGIGLSLTKELVEMHSGIITVYNVHGKGACFTVVIPRGDKPIHSGRMPTTQTAFQEYAVPVSEDNNVEDIPEADQETLLFIEDDGDLRCYLKDELKGQYRILEASDGAQGLKKARQFVPDLIVSDVMMCGMDGLELCRKLKSDAVTSHIPIILLTARSTEEHQVEGLETGADDYIAKPFHLQALKARIRNLLASRRKLRERFSREIRVEPADIVVTSTDEKFLRRAIKTIEAHLSDSDFGVESFGREIGLSRSQLFRKIKGLTSETPIDFIQTIRLRRAAQLLEKSDLSVTEISYEVGFKYPSHFSQLFHAKFGQSPKEYRQRPVSSDR
jgi:signal transduction histidine kinase/DNA-binding response OmpR family regulator/streptogramin lyase